MDVETKWDFTDAEDHELGRVERGDADGADKTPTVEVVLSHDGLVTAYKERLDNMAPAGSGRGV
jgi:hypothetical protein